MAPLPEATSDFKTRTRHGVLTTRATKGQHEYMLDDEALAQRLQEWLSNTAGDLANPVIAAYVPTGDEPGASVSNSTGGEPGQDFVGALANAVPSTRILLPACPSGPPQPLHWGYYNGSFSKGRFGLLEPVSVESAAGPEELGAADVIILPAAAADPASGMRLGRGADYYDRSLVFVRCDGGTDGVRAAAIAVTVFNTELHTELIYDEYDVPADYVITPTRISRIQRDQFRGFHVQLNMSPKHSSRFPHPFSKLRPTTIRWIVALTVFLCATGLAAVESLAPCGGHTRVVISAKSIAAGASAAEQDVAFKDIPRDLVPGRAVTDIAAVRGRTLATGMPPDEIFAEQRMVGPSFAKSLTGTSESKIIAITLIDPGIVSALHTGDSVDIVSTADERGMAAPIAHGARVVNIVGGEVVLITLPAGIAEVVTATSLASPLTLLLVGE